MEATVFAFFILISAISYHRVSQYITGPDRVRKHSENTLPEYSYSVYYCYPTIYNDITHIDLSIYTYGTQIATMRPQLRPCHLI